MAFEGEYIDVDASKDGGTNRTDIDEIITEMTVDGRVDSVDEDNLQSLKTFFEGEKGSQLDDTKSAIQEMFQDMLVKGYTITEGNFDTFNTILQILGKDLLDTQSLLDIEDGIEDTTFSLTYDVSSNRFTVHAPEEGDEDDIIKYGYFGEDGKYVQASSGGMFNTDDFLSNGGGNNNTVDPEQVFPAIEKDLDERRDAIIDEQAVTIDDQLATINANASLQGDLTTAEDLAARRLTIIGGLEGEKEALAGQVYSLTAQTDALTGALSAVGDENDQLKLDIEKWKGDLDIAQAKITELETAASAHESSMQQSMQDLAAAKAAAEALQRRIDDELLPRITQLEISESTLKEQVEQLEARPDIDQGVLDALRATISTQETTIAELRQELETAQSAITTTSEQTQEVFLSIIEEYIQQNTISSDMSISELISLSLSTKQFASQATTYGVDQMPQVFLEFHTQIEQTLKDRFDARILSLNADISSRDSTKAELQAQLSLLQEQGEIINFPTRAFNLLQARIDHIEETPEEVAPVVVQQPEQPPVGEQEEEEQQPPVVQPVAVPVETPLQGIAIKTDHRVSGEHLQLLDNVESPTKEMILGILRKYLEEHPVYIKSEYNAFWKSSEGYQAAYAVQVALTSLGKDLGVVDGMWGPKSQAALSELGQGKNPGPKSIQVIINMLESNS